MLSMYKYSNTGCDFTLECLTSAIPAIWGRNQGCDASRQESGMFACYMVERG